MPRQHLVIGDGVDISRPLAFLAGSAVVHAVDILGQQDDVGVDLRRPQHRRSVGGEERALPVPQPKITTRPFSRCRMARARI